MKFSVNRKQYRESLIKLRHDLNDTLEEGSLKEDFQERLATSEEVEKALLKELLTYYRIYAPDLYTTRIKEVPVKVEGSYRMPGYLKTCLQIERDLFLVATSAPKVFFLRILERERPKIELSPAIKNFNEGILSIQAVNKQEIFIFTFTGEVFLLSYQEVQDLFEEGNHFSMRQVQTGLPAFERIIGLGKEQFLGQIGKRKLYLLEFNKENLEFKRKAQVEVPEDVEEITDLLKISKSRVGIGTITGDLLLARVTGKEIKIEEKTKISNQPVKKLALLENENLEKRTCAVLGGEEMLAFYDLENKKIVDFGENIKGSGLDLVSREGSAFLLTEDGHGYLLEENRGKWKANQKVTLRERFFIKTMALSPSDYLAVDLDGNFSLLQVDRLDSIEKLHHLSLYH